MRQAVEVASMHRPDDAMRVRGLLLPDYDRLPARSRGRRVRHELDMAAPLQGDVEMHRGLDGVRRDQETMVLSVSARQYGFSASMGVGACKNSTRYPPGGAQPT